MQKVFVRAGLVASLAVLGCNKEEPAPPPPPPAASAPAPAASTEIDPTKMLFFPALPKEAPAPKENLTTDAKVELGHRLFFDEKLSTSGKVSCESCHELQHYGVDGLPAEKVTAKTEAPLRNTPTVYNVGMNGTYGWDGVATTLEAFLKTHITSPNGLDAAEKTLPHTLKKEYRKEFETAFAKGADAASLDHAADALAAYLRRLQTPAAWDKFASGDKSALTADQKKGFNEFTTVGCTTCHSGPNAGGSLVQKLGLVKPWPSKTPVTDEGRYQATKQDADKMMFRSAPLRNITKTGPYLHDGSVANLDEMISLMAEHQLGKTPTKDEVASVVAFLGAFTGELPPASLIEPPGKK